MENDRMKLGLDKLMEYNALTIAKKVFNQRELEVTKAAPN